MLRTQYPELTIICAEYIDEHHQIFGEQNRCWKDNAEGQWAESLLGTKLAEHGIDCTGKTSRQITKRDYEYYDYIVAMDQSNLRNLRRMLGEDTQGKISLLMDYTSRPADVADPWYTGDFQATWDDVNEGCKELLTFIMNKNK